PRPQMWPGLLTRPPPRPQVSSSSVVAGSPDPATAPTAGLLFQARRPAVGSVSRSGDKGTTGWFLARGGILPHPWNVSGRVILSQIRTPRKICLQCSPASTGACIPFSRGEGGAMSKQTKDSTPRIDPKPIHSTNGGGSAVPFPQPFRGKIYDDITQTIGHT